MKIARVVATLGALALFQACAAGRPPQASAPGESPRAAASASAADDTAQDSLKTTAPAPAPAAPPVGLEQRSEPSRLEPDQEFTSLDAAERALEQAKADLDRLALAEPTPTVGRSTAADRAAEKKAGTKGNRPSAAAGVAEKAAPTSVCENACRAFSSLSRAADAVCRLDGSRGAHCTRAKRIVVDSEPRVASCSCPVTED